MARLTAQILRDAADLLAPGGSSLTDCRFMCLAVEEVATVAQRVEFRQCLLYHGVALNGHLYGPDVDRVDTAWGGEPAQDTAQNLRFDFLNLLACSLDSE